MNVPDEKALRHLNASMNLDALWMPFTANRQFKTAPRLLASAKDLHYQTVDCGGALKIIAAIEDPPVIIKILSHLGLPTRAPARRVDLFQAKPTDRSL